MNKGDMSKTIKCIFCKKNKPLDDFDEYQINNPWKKKNKAVNGVRCKKCTQVPRTEIFCVICRKHKPLKEFTLTQRKSKNDQASCKKCVERRQESDDDEFDQDETL